MTRKRCSARRVLGLFLRLAVAVVLLVFVLYSSREQLAGLRSRQIDLANVVMAFLFYIGGVLLAFTRWFGLVRALGLPFRYVDALRLGFIGLLFNLVIPGAIGGDVIKAAFLCREQGKRTQPIASCVIDRLLGLLGLFLLAFGAGLAGWKGLPESVHELVVTAGIASLVTAGILALAFFPIGRVRPGRSAKWRVELAAVGASYRTHPASVVLGLLMSVATHALNVSAFYFLSQALFPSVPSIFAHLLIVPIVLFSTALPLPFGALGASEAISLELFRLTGHPGGALAMMGFRVLQLAGGLIGLGVYGANLTTVRELKRTALPDQSEPGEEAGVAGEASSVAT